MNKYVELLNLVGLVKRSFPAHTCFNVFRALRAEHDEVRLHSRFLAALVDPSGHALGGDALRALLKTLDIPLTGPGAFSTDNVLVRTEEQSIDILVTNSKHQVLIIENKIYASDQYMQLRRYFQAMRAARYTDIFIAYLTLDGHAPADDSLDGLEREPGCRFQNASYEYHIRTWLCEVERIAVRDPHLRESVSQYLAVIDKLTGNDFEKAYMDELVATLLTNDNIKRARDIRAAYTRTLACLQERVWDGLIKVFQRDYSDMAVLVTDDSLPQDQAERMPIINRFYQPSARKRTYYGLYFCIPGFDHVVVAIEIEAGLYTGAYCPSEYPDEYERASAALKNADLHGHQTPNWPMWRECVLSDDFFEPEEPILELLSNESARAKAVEQCARDVYATWKALKQYRGAA